MKSRMKNLIQRIGLAWLALAALFTLGAFTASSAVALPEFGKCVAKAEGKYTESNCATKAKTGQPHIFERVKANEIAKVGFTASGGSMFFEEQGGVKIVCSASTASGKLDKDGTSLAAKGVENVIFRFTGCAINFFKCQSGTTSEEIVSGELEGNLVYASKAKKEVLLELHPMKKGGAFMSFECERGTITVVVKEGTKGGNNCIFSKISPVDVMSNASKDIYKISETEAGRQVPQTDEKLKPAKCNLEEEVSGGPPEWVALNQEPTIKWEEEIEIFG
jgi:hypothetical protein